MFSTAALGFINHLLEGEAWARARLQPFSGQTARFICGPLVVSVVITECGILASASANDSPAVTFTLPASALWRAAGDRAALIAEARINGAADLAECLGFVLRNLRWEIEDDLAPLVGDIAARRLVQGGRSFATWQQRQARELALNLSEYFTAENPLIVGREAVSTFAQEVERARQETDRLAHRLDALLPPDAR